MREVKSLGENLGDYGNGNPPGGMGDTLSRRKKKILPSDRPTT